MIRKIIEKCGKIAQRMNEDHTGAYAAQSAFFIVLSLVPIILLLITLVQFTPVTKSDVILAVREVFPKSFNTMIIDVVQQVYNQSTTIIPVTIVVAMWSAGRGVLSMSNGLNSVYGICETRNYIFLRVRATIYTLLFIISIVLTLVLLVFGNTLSVFVDQHISSFSEVMNFIIQIRTVLVFCVLTMFSSAIYRFLPNRKARFRHQIPGGIFTAVGWLFVSYIFSIYLKIFKGFSTMYGSLTTIMLVMLWLYFCMYIMLLGGELNVFLREALEDDFRERS